MLKLETSEERQRAKRYLKYLLGDNYDYSRYRRTSMLFGINKENKEISILNATKEDKFTCPVCKRPLNIADGKINIKHFKHIDNDNNNNEKCLEYSPMRLIAEDLTEAIKTALENKKYCFKKSDDKYCTSFKKVSILTEISSYWLEQLYAEYIVEKEYNGTPYKEFKGLSLTKKGKELYETKKKIKIKDF